MPTCPKCGSPRVDRYCAYCGAAAVHPQAVPAPNRPTPRAGAPVAARGGAPARKKGSWAPALVGLLTMGGIVGMFMAHVSERRAPVAAPAIVSVPRDVGEYLRQFEADADFKLMSARASLTQASAAPSRLDGRLSQVKSELDEVFNLRERL